MKAFNFLSLVVVSSLVTGAVALADDSMVTHISADGTYTTAYRDSDGKAFEGRPVMIENVDSSTIRVTEINSADPMSALSGDQNSETQHIISVGFNNVMKGTVSYGVLRLDKNYLYTFEAGMSGGSFSIGGFKLNNGMQTGIPIPARVDLEATVVQTWGRPGNNAPTNTTFGGVRLNLNLYTHFNACVAILRSSKVNVAMFGASLSSL